MMPPRTLTARFIQAKHSKGKHAIFDLVHSGVLGKLWIDGTEDRPKVRFRTNLGLQFEIAVDDSKSDWRLICQDCSTRNEILLLPFHRDTFLCEKCAETGSWGIPSEIRSELIEKLRAINSDKAEAQLRKLFKNGTNCH